jgi:Uma2 family endonuclease
VRAPNFAFIRQDRLTSPRPTRRWVPVIPQLAVEVASSADRLAEIREKAAMWLNAGVRLVWVVLAGACVVEVYRADQAVLRLDKAVTVDGADVVPGFSTPVAAIFGE